MLQFTSIDPLFITFGPVAIRWYGIAYMASLIIGYFFIKYLNNKGENVTLPELALDNLIVYSAIGIIIGGRLGYILIYAPHTIISDALEVFRTWNGGMSFHGGLIGMICAMYLLSLRYKLNFLRVMDMLACVAPIGLFLGRIANYINCELYGRVTNVKWAVIFPCADDLPRHPSQLYEAFFEGIVLFFLLNIFYLRKGIRAKQGFVSGLFLIGYSIIRISVENYREPDAHLGFIAMYMTMGQIVTLPMLMIGVYLVYTAAKPREVY